MEIGPLVSVLIPAYNHENFVEETILSIVLQSYMNIELIIIDDGSTDNTWDKITNILDLYNSRFNHVYCKTRKNLGTALTANELISHAKGKYIYSIASDDVAKPIAIEKMVNFLEKNQEYVLVVGDNEIINRHGKVVGWDKNKCETLLSKSKYKTMAQFLHLSRYGQNFGSYQYLVRGNHIPNGYLCLSKALKSIHPFTNEAPLEDWYMHLQMSKLGKYAFLDEILFSYRWHESNSMLDLERMRKITEQTLLYEKKIVSFKGNEKWRKLFYDNYKIVKIKFSIKNIFKYYTIKTIVSKKNILEIFGRKFVVNLTLKNLFKKN